MLPLSLSVPFVCFPHVFTLVFLLSSLFFPFLPCCPPPCTSFPSTLLSLSRSLLPPSAAFSLFGYATSLFIYEFISLSLSFCFSHSTLRCPSAFNSACYPPTYLFLGIVFNFSDARSSNVVSGACVYNRATPFA